MSPKARWVGLVATILLGCGQGQSEEEKASSINAPPTVANIDNSVPSRSAGGEVPEVVIGRWCDRMVPNIPKFSVVLEIVSVGDRTFKRLVQRDGKVTESDLKERGGNLFAMVDSPSGDSYRIVPSDGSLQLIDNDGLIRTASRLENKAKPGEC